MLKNLLYKFFILDKLSTTASYCMLPTNVHENIIIKERSWIRHTRDRNKLAQFCSVNITSTGFWYILLELKLYLWKPCLKTTRRILIFVIFAISLWVWFFTASRLKDLAFIIAESKLQFLRIITGYYNYAYPLKLHPEICQVRLFYIFTATNFVQNFTLVISRKYLLNFPRNTCFWLAFTSWLDCLIFATVEFKGSVIQSWSVVRAFTSTLILL